MKKNILLIQMCFLFSSFLVQGGHITGEEENNFKPIKPLIFYNKTPSYVYKTNSQESHCVHLYTSPILTPDQKCGITKDYTEDYRIIFNGDSTGMASVWFTCAYMPTKQEIFSFSVFRNYKEHPNPKYGKGYFFVKIIDTSFFHIHPKIKFNNHKELKISEEAFNNCFSKFSSNCDLPNKINKITFEKYLDTEYKNFYVGFGYLTECDLFGEGKYFSDIDFSQPIFYAMLVIYDKINLCWTYMNNPEVFYCYEEIGSIAETSLTSTLLYPNPANSTCTISGNLSALVRDFSITISDIKGTELFEVCKQQNLDGEFSFSFDTKFLPSGSYNVILNADGKEQIKKLIIER